MRALELADLGVAVFALDEEVTLALEETDDELGMEVVLEEARDELKDEEVLLAEPALTMPSIQTLPADTIEDTTLGPMVG